jgi:ribosomal protein S12 methylthiotransferase accessory factor
MTPLIPCTKSIHHSALFWKDPDSSVWYETTSYGATHLQRSGAAPGKRVPVTPEAVVTSVGQQMVLVASIFCSPRLWWEQLAAHPGQTIIPVFFHRGRLLLGPGFHEGGPVCPTCAALRLGQGFPHPQVFKSLLCGPITSATDASLEPIWTLLGEITLARFARTHCDRLQSGELAEFSLTDEQVPVSWHYVLPPPGDHPRHEVEEEVAHLFAIPDTAWPDTFRPSPRPSPSTLVDPLVGPLLSTVEVPPEAQEPKGLTGYATIIGHLGKYTRWHPDVSGSGLGYDPEQARLASIGEGVERYSGNYIPQDRLVFASEDELVHLGRPYVSLSRLCPFTKEQETTAGWPFARPGSSSNILWIEAQDLLDPGKNVLLPAEFVCLNLTRLTRQQSQIPVPLAGIAAHRRREAAIEAALLELVERDATMLWWHGNIPAKQLTELPSALQSQIEHGVPEHIQQWFLLLATEMPAYVVAGCVYDREKEILVAGFAARPNLSDAVRKASAEAWQLRRVSLQLLNRESVIWQAIDEGKLPMPVRPFRPDRSYRKAFRDDFADMHQLAYNLQFHLDPSTHSEAFARLSGEPCPYHEVPGGGDVIDGVVTACLVALSQSGKPAYCADLTTPDIATLGFTVVRVVCPTLVGNTPTAFVPLAHRRLQEVLSRQQHPPYLGPLPHA